MIELPYAYKQSPDPWMLFLVARGDALLRLFVGDEILVGYTVTLVAAGRYQIKILRARFGTRRRMHVAGAEALALVIGQNTPLEYQLPWNQGMTAATFKVQPYLMHNELDLGSCPEVTENVQRRAYCPPPPLNLRVNGDGYAPTYLAGEDITVDWDGVSGLRAATPATQDLAPDPDQAVIASHDAAASTGRSVNSIRHWPLDHHQR